MPYQDITTEISRYAIVLEQDGSYFCYILGDLSGGASDWNDLANKPEMFPPREHTHPVSDITDLEQKLTEIAAGGELSLAGKSAYESWLELPGNAGKSETEFIASLKGEKGEAGEPGIQGPTGEVDRVVLTQEQYDNLETIIHDTFYLIPE